MLLNRKWNYTNVRVSIVRSLAILHDNFMHTVKPCATHHLHNMCGMFNEIRIRHLGSKLCICYLFTRCCWLQQPNKRRTHSIQFNDCSRLAADSSNKAKNKKSSIFEHIYAHDLTSAHMMVPIVMVIYIHAGLKNGKSKTSWYVIQRCCLKCYSYMIARMRERESFLSLIAIFSPSTFRLAAILF